jgi:predicted nucleic acid-binding protein
MYLLDTCVVSEGPKLKRNPAVARWIEAQDTASLFISAVTAGELRYGVARLAAGREAMRLDEWLRETLEKGFAERILPFDERIADLWGHLRADNPNAEIADSQIAATALVHNLTLVTRNVKDFKFGNLPLVNPWES